MMRDMSNFPRYEAYKESGEEWLGKIPEDWNFVPLRSLLNFRNERNDPIKTENILSLSIAHGVTRYSDKGRGGNKRKEDITAYKIAYPKDIVMNSMNVIVGAVGISKYHGAISPVYYALYAKNKTVNIFFYEKIFQDKGFQRSLLRFGKGILIKFGEARKMNTIRMKVSPDDLKTIKLPYPPLNQQILISKFLDQKTAQIDQAISIKVQQIELLQERKQIIIQQAVIQGLNPDVPMKDSGVDWIGQIPEHWEVKRLKYVFEEQSERSKTGEEPLFMMSQVHGLVVRADYHEKAEVAANNINNKVVRKNDLVFNKLKPHLGVFFKSNIDYKGLVSPDYAVYRCIKYIYDSKYLELLFRHPLYIKQFVIRATGIVEGLVRLYTGDLFDISVPIPPENEQLGIIKHIEKKSMYYEQAIALETEQIERLKEYKTTLINSAVTGKIKITPDMLEA